MIKDIVIIIGIVAIIVLIAFILIKQGRNSNFKTYSLTIAGLILLSCAIYFSMQNSYSWNEVRYMTITNELTRNGEKITKAVDVVATKDYKQISLIFLLVSLFFLSVSILYRRQNSMSKG